MDLELIKGQDCCNRTACQEPFGPWILRGVKPWWNTSTRAWYCRQCAAMINRFAIGAGGSNLALCFEKGSPGFLALQEEEKP
jgi:hypothetical protein